MKNENPEQVVTTGKVCGKTDLGRQREKNILPQQVKMLICELVQSVGQSEDVEMRVLPCQPARYK